MLDLTSFFSRNDRVSIYQPGICHPDGKHIFGLVRYMSLGGMQRKVDTQAYIRLWNSRIKP